MTELGKSLIQEGIEKVRLREKLKLKL